jgi:hypothetical protein
MFFASFLAAVPVFAFIPWLGISNDIGKKQKEA